MSVRAPRTAAVPVLVLAVSVLALAPASGVTAAAPVAAGEGTGAGPGAGAGVGAATGARAGAGRERGPGVVAEVSGARLELADEVAAAKYGTGRPIDDPVREREVLAEVAGRAAGRGVDARWAKAVFRDQIEANKAVQRGLYARWDAYPEERPARRPDLGREVRPALDRVTTELLRGLAATQKAHGVRGARDGAVCAARLTVGGARTAYGRHFDALHAAALVRAVRAVC